MNFLSRHSKIYQSAVIINPYVRYCISALIITSLVLTWWYGLYTWSRNKVRNAKVEIATLEKKVTDLVAAQKAVSNLEQEIEQLQQKISDYRPSSMAQAQQEQMVAILNSTASSGMSLVGYTTQEQKEKVWYISQIVQTELAGSYDQMLKFFTSLKECKKMIQCDHLQCTIGKSGECLVSAQLKMTVPLRTITERKET